MNPLLAPDALPRFDAIEAAHIAPAVDFCLREARQALETVVTPDFPADWRQVAAVLDVATERLGRVWGAVSHLHAVADTPALRQAYTEALPRVTEFWTQLGADERLYAKYKAMDVNALNAEQKRAHHNAMRNFVLSGAELQGEAKKRFAEIQETLANLQQKFSEHVLDSTDGWSLTVGAERLAGLPPDVLAATQEAARAQGDAGHRLTLKMPCYLPVMQFAHSSALREKLYKAYTTRASDQAEGEAQKYDNTAHMREILALRQEEARLLGYDNFAQVSVVP